MARGRMLYRDVITVIDDNLFKSQKIILSKAIRQEMFSKIRNGHMSVQKWKERGRDVIYVKIPLRPWLRVATDLLI